MGLLADFYISTDDAAADYDESDSWPELERAQYKNITPLELSALWAAMRHQEWHAWREWQENEFECLLNADDGERLIYRFPPAFVSLLASLDPDAFTRTAEDWTETDAIPWDTPDAQEVLEDIVRLARAAAATGRHLYLWNCV